MSGPRTRRLLVPTRPVWDGTPLSLTVDSKSSRSSYGTPSVHHPPPPQRRRPLSPVHPPSSVNVRLGRRVERSTGPQEVSGVSTRRGPETRGLREYSDRVDFGRR